VKKLDFALHFLTLIALPAFFTRCSTISALNFELCATSTNPTFNLPASFVAQEDGCLPKPTFLEALAASKA
jgi:hypothetical protein